MLFQGQSCCFDHHVIKTHTYFTGVIDRLPSLHCGIHVDAYGQIKMRCREFTFSQSTCNGLAHLTNSNFGESLYTGCDSAHSSSLKRLHIAFHNAPSFARSGDVSYTESSFFSQLLSQGRCFQAAIGSRNRRHWCRRGCSGCCSLWGWCWDRSSCWDWRRRRSRCCSSCWCRSFLCLRRLCFGLFDELRDIFSRIA